MINIEIDGKKCEAEPGSMVIAVADKEGIYIPRFCYHKKLSIAANCRMCLVEVEKSGKPLPACATPVMEGMKVFTRSKMALDAQKSVMEFLLINHPLDCPICDQGGECELQDLSMGFGTDGSRYTEDKRSVKDKEIGSLISTCMTRCIQCTRCVRFGREVAGLPELGATGRGENMEIGTYVEHSLVSEVSGNIIDLCPVGALLSKPFKFSARAWELDQYASVAPHDCIGSNIHIHTRRNVVMRVAPKDNENINETWISDRDRFSYVGLSHEDRLQKPMIKKNGKWEETDWQTALNVAVHGLQDAGDGVGVLVSPNSTLEEMYLLKKLCQGLGTDNLDHRLRQTDFSHAQPPVMECSIADLEKQDAVLLVGSNIRHEQPIAGLRVRKAALKGAKIFCVNPIDFDFNFPVTQKWVVSPEEMLEELKNPEIVKQLKKAQNSVVVLGAIAEQHSQAGKLRALAEDIAKKTESKLVCLTDGANTAGAWLTGIFPQKSGLNAQSMFAKQLKAYVVMGIEPELDCANGVLIKAALTKAECVVALSPFKNDAVLEYAHVILPIAPFSETSGTFVNVEGAWQSFKGVVPPLGETRPGWKVLRVLGNLLGFEGEGFEGFECTSSEEIKNEICRGDTCVAHDHVTQHSAISISGEIKEEVKKEIKKEIGEAVAVYAAQTKPLPAIDKAIHGFDGLRNDTATASLTRIVIWPMYRVDSLVRRSQPLQDSAAAEKPGMYINAATAKKVKLGGDLPVIVDARIPDGCVYIPAGFPEIDMGASL